jgi:DNA-binding transcriptional MerR regulator
VTKQVLTLRDMTDGSGCTPRTVRYYEREGLLRALRSAGGHRQFAASELERLNFIISLREAGWSLEEVTELLGIRDAASNDSIASEQLTALVARQVERLDKKIAILQRLREDLLSTAQLLPVCRECTTVKEIVECGTCDRVPAIDRLPRAFRLVWRARELPGAQIYDEQAADTDD